jgi:hypothetical protein
MLVAYGATLEQPWPLKSWEHLSAREIADVSLWALFPIAAVALVCDLNQSILWQAFCAIVIFLKYWSMVLSGGFEWQNFWKIFLDLFLYLVMAIAAFIALVILYALMIPYSWFPTPVTIIVAVMSAALVAANHDRLKLTGQKNGKLSNAITIVVWTSVMTACIILIFKLVHFAAKLATGLAVILFIAVLALLFRIFGARRSFPFFIVWQKITGFNPMTR